MRWRMTTTASGFSNGILQVSVTYTKNESIYMTVSGGGVQGQSNSINVLLPGECGCGE